MSEITPLRHAKLLREEALFQTTDITALLWVRVTAEVLAKILPH